MRLIGHLFGLALFAASLSACREASASTYEARTAQERTLSAIVSNYSGYEGVEVVKVGGLGTTLLKGVIRASVMDDVNDPEVRAVLGLIRDVKGVTIVDYEDAPGHVRDAINAEVGALCASQDNLLVEAKDEDGSMYVFSAPDTRGQELRDLVLFTPSDGALVWIKGKISVDAIAAMAGR